MTLDTLRALVAALYVAGCDMRAAFIASAIGYDAARHATGKGNKITSAAIVALNKERAAVAGVPSYRSATSVDCHALTGAALSHGYDDETDPYALQSEIIAAVAVIGMSAARKILRAEHETASDALAALLAAVAAHVPADETADETETDETETADETADDETETATRISTGLALILDALNDGETFDETETATFLALVDQILATSVNA